MRRGIAVDGADAYITARRIRLTSRSRTHSRAQRRRQDAFIARLGADGNSLLFQQYLGGSGGSPTRSRQGLRWTAGHAYVTGVTSSANSRVGRGATSDSVHSTLCDQSERFRHFGVQHLLGV